MRRKHMRGINVEMVPQEGCLLAYFDNSLVFVPYTVKNGRAVFAGDAEYQDMEPRECHLFDGEREYRMIRREARNDKVEIVLSRHEEDLMDPDLIYEERVMVKEEYFLKGNLPEYLKIINRYMFTDNDTLVLKNYRISF